MIFCNVLTPLAVCMRMTVYCIEKIESAHDVIMLQNDLCLLEQWEKHVTFWCVVVKVSIFQMGQYTISILNIIDTLAIGRDLPGYTLQDTCIPSHKYIQNTGS